MTIQGFAPHTITINVSQVGVDWYRPMIVLAQPARDLTLLSPTNSILAVVDAADGHGNVVLISDCSLWMNDSPSFSDRPITFGDNRLLLQNILAFIGGQVKLYAQQEGRLVRLFWPRNVTPYHVQWTDSLNGGPWQTLTNTVGTAGDWTVVFDSFAASRCYYRLAK